MFVRTLLAVGAAVPAQAPAEGGGVTGFGPGERLPALELPTIDRTRTVRLSDLRGRRLLLIQFASW